jgi:hypothetical protein
MHIYFQDIQEQPESLSDSNDDDASQRSHTSRDDLRAFHVVFCLGKVDKNYTRTIVATMKQYKRIAQQIAVALRFEKRLVTSNSKA